MDVARTAVRLVSEANVITADLRRICQREIVEAREEG